MGFRLIIQVFLKTQPLIQATHRGCSWHESCQFQYKDSSDLVVWYHCWYTVTFHIFLLLRIVHTCSVQIPVWRAACQCYHIQQVTTGLVKCGEHVIGVLTEHTLYITWIKDLVNRCRPLLVSWVIFLNFAPVTAGLSTTQTSETCGIGLFCFWIIEVVIWKVEAVFCDLLIMHW